MPKVTDNELDKLFREAADRIAPEFDPGDWEDMARRLELEETAARGRSKTLYTMVALLIIYSLVPMWRTNPIADAARAGVAIGSPNVDVARADVAMGSTKADVAKTDVAIGSTKADAARADVAMRAPKADVAKTDVAIGFPKADVAITDVAIGSRKVGQDHAKSRSDSGSSSAGEKFDADKRDGPSITTGAWQSESLNDKSTTGPAFQTDGGMNWPAASIHQKRDIHGDGTLVEAVIAPEAIIKPVELASMSHMQTIIPQVPIHAVRPWFIKLPVSPDYSSIDYNSPGDPGINIGLLGEYQFTRHFSVSTGAIWSKKLYDAKNPDKSYSSGNWTAKASKLEGDCRVLDIPINITYYLFPERKTNLFFTVGASSYIMLKEQYVYTVWANHKEYQYEEDFSHKNNEWFSMLNVSIGVQQHLGKRFALQAEPFLKAPMSGVGEGKVNLVSTGVFISLKYQLTR